MLPPGIFLAKTEEGACTARELLEAVRESHPSWAADLDAYGLWKACAEKSPWDGPLLQSDKEVDSTILITPSCASTMELAHQAVSGGLLDTWGVVVSVVQTSGRGQLRRPWVSLPGNLHASIVMPSPPASGPWKDVLPDLLPLVAGHVVASVLSVLGAELELKWPNDILQNGRKVGGLLIEERNGTAVLGFGLNLVGNPSDDQMREDHSVPASKITFSSSPGGALTLVETLVNRGKSVYAVMLDEIPPTRFVAMVGNRLAWMGRSVLIQDGGQPPYEAIITGLTPAGGLVVRRGGEETVLFSGSIFPL